MENIVTINNTKENTFELNVSVQGLSTPDIRVWFTISANGMDICFTCEREGSGDKWICTVPPLPFIEKTAYPCSLQVVGDGYYFEPFNGTLNVTGSAEIYSSTPKNVTIKPANRQDQKPKDDDKKDDKKKSNVIKLEPPSKNKTKSKEKSIEQIAEELMKKNGDKKVVALPKKKPLTPKATQRAAAKKILKEEANVKAKKVAAKKTEKIDAAVKKITESAKKPVVKKPVTKPVAKKTIEPIVEKTIEPIVEKIEKKLENKVGTVKKIVEALKPTKKVARKETVIPPAKLSNKLSKSATKPADTSKEDVVKNILESIGIKLKDSENSDVKIHTDVKRSLPTNLNRGEVVVDIDQIARELMEKAKLDPKNIDKKLAAQKAEAAKKIEESDAPVGKKNDAVMAILEDLGVKPDGATKSVKISFIKKDIH